jgi:hypothetical protein
MALPTPEEVKDDRLHLFVIGPGTGETVLLRIPPKHWVIIDSFRCGTPSRPAAESIVARYGGKVAILALTHPHHDHYPGFVDLIDRYGDAVLGCVHPQDAGGMEISPTDAMAALNEGAKPAFTRIWDEWNRDAKRRWDTFRGERRTVGEASVTSLHPARPVSARQWGSDPNAISSAMLVEWHGLRLLLGADVTGGQWPGIANAFPRLSDHAALKVPHHGSRGAMHEAFGDGTPGRFWVITPFKRWKLPSAADHTKSGELEGLRQALSFVNEVRLTSLPFSHALEFEDPCFATRAQVRDATHPPRTPRSDDSADTGAEKLDRQIVVAFDRSGRVLREWYGRGSVRVTR